MRIEWKNSVQARLLMMVAGSVLMTTGIVASGSFFAFYQMNDGEQRSDVARYAQEAANGVHAALERWSSLAFLIHDSFSSRRSTAMARLNRITSNQSEVLMASVFKATSSKPWIISSIDHNDPRFQGTVPKDVAAAIADMHRIWIGSARASGRPFLIADTSPNTKVPTISFAMRSDSRGSRWVILTLWQTNLLAALPTLPTYIVDGDGKTVFSTVGAEAGIGTLAPTDYQAIQQDGELDAGVLRAPGLPIISFLTEPYIGFFKNRALGLTTAVIPDAHFPLWYALLILSWVGVGVFAVGLVALRIGQKSGHRLNRLERAIRKIAQGNFDMKLKSEGRDEIAILGRSIQHMSDQVRRLVAAKLAAAIEKREQRIVDVAQTALVPSSSPPSELFDIYGRSKGAAKYGGDWWGHFHHDCGKEILMIAKATGRGAQGALVSAVGHGSSRMFSHLMGAFDEVDQSPTQWLAALNRVLWDTGSGSTTMTCFLATVDTRSGELRYASAGHIAPLLVPRKTDDDRLAIDKQVPKTEQVLTLQGRGKPLGKAEDLVVQEHSLTLRRGDKLVLYTDGIVECTNPEGRSWGRAVLRQKVNEFRDSTAEQMKNRLVTAAFKFFAGRPVEDDVTVVVAEVKETWTPRRSEEGTAA